MEESPFYDRELETSSRERLRELQNEKLLRLMSELETNEFYNQKLRAAGLALADVRSIEDLRSLPFTTKAELVEEQKSHPPFGRLLTYPRSRYPYFHQTSGTTGNPLRWLDTQESWDCWRRCWGFVFRGAGVTADDIVFLAFSFGPYISHWIAISGAWHIGAMCISGGGLNSLQRLNVILDNRCTVLLCTPTYALHLAEVAREHGLDLRSSALRLGIHAGEPGASVPNVKRMIEDSFAMRVFDHAGATEVGAWGFACGAAESPMHLNEADFIFEVIDPTSGLPAAERERGELVITNLSRPGMPVLRYRTGDLVEITTEPCSCGRRMAWVKGGVLGRVDDMLFVRGVNVYPSMIDNIIRAVPEITEYEVELRRVRGLDDLFIRIETARDRAADGVISRLTDLFRQQLNIRVNIERAEAGSLPRYEFKARRYKRIN